MTRRFWLPIIISLPLTIIFVIVSLVTSESGFENYNWTIVLFPYVMLSTKLFGEILPVLGIVSLFQWIFYGVIIGKAWKNDRLISAIEVILIVHLAAVALAIKALKYSNHFDHIIFVK